jgi:hypothetical protein
MIRRNYVKYDMIPKECPQCYIRLKDDQPWVSLARPVLLTILLGGTLVLAWWYLLWAVGIVLIPLNIPRVLLALVVYTWPYLLVRFLVKPLIWPSVSIRCGRCSWRGYYLIDPYSVPEKYGH